MLLKWKLQLQRMTGVATMELMEKGNARETARERPRDGQVSNSRAGPVEGVAGDSTTAS